MTDHARAVLGAGSRSPHPLKVQLDALPRYSMCATQAYGVEASPDHGTVIDGDREFWVRASDLDQVGAAVPRAPRLEPDVVERLRFWRKEYGTFGHLSGESLNEIDALADQLSAARAPREPLEPVIAALNRLHVAFCEAVLLARAEDVSEEGLQALQCRGDDAFSVAWDGLSPAAPQGLTDEDIDQIVDGLDNFCIGPVENEELRAIWQPYIDKLQALKVAAARSALPPPHDVDICANCEGRGYFLKQTLDDYCRDHFGTGDPIPEPSAALPRVPEPDQPLPCPFCSSVDVNVQHLVDEDDYYVNCNACEVQQIANYTKAEAIRRWKVRAARAGAEAPPDQRAMFSRVLAALESDATKDQRFAAFNELRDHAFPIVYR